MTQYTVARYETRCAVCSEPIEVDDQIVSDHTGSGWMHLDCFDGNTADPDFVDHSKDDILCDQCFLFHRPKCCEYDQ